MHRYSRKDINSAARRVSQPVPSIRLNKSIQAPATLLSFPATVMTIAIAIAGALCIGLPKGMTTVGIAFSSQLRG